MRKTIITLVAALSLTLASESVAQPASQATPGPIASAATHAKKCKRIRNKKKRRRCIRRAGPHSPTSTDSNDPLIQATFNAAARHGDALYRDHSSYPEGTYYYLVRLNECTRINSYTARCLVYLWKQAYGTGYGAGGYDRSVWREYVFGYQYGSSYQYKVNFIDFIDPWYWVCSDTPRYNIPYCNGPISW